MPGTFTLGRKGRRSGRLFCPRGVAILKGHLAVSDDAGRVQVWSGCAGAEPRPRLVREVGRGKLLEPRGVAFDAHKCLVVVDSAHGRVEVFDGLGDEKLVLRDLARPYGVAMGLFGRYVVTEEEGHRVKVFEPDGSLALCFGSKGAGPDQLSCPRGVAVMPDGRIVVADYGNARVQVFKPDGSPAMSLGAGGADAFGVVTGVAADAEGRLVVSDYAAGGVRLLGPAGALLDARPWPPQASGVAVDAAGRVWVADCAAHRVHMLDWRAREGKTGT